MKRSEGEMVAFELGAAGRGFPDSVSKRTSSKSTITSEFDPQQTWVLWGSQLGSKPFDLIAGAALGAVRNSRNDLAATGSLAAVAAASENVTLARNSGGIGTN